MSYEPFLLVITQLCVGAGFNDSNILANLSRAAIPPLLARCDNAAGNPAVNPLLATIGPLSRSGGLAVL